MSAVPMAETDSHVGCRLRAPRVVNRSGAERGVRVRELRQRADGRPASGEGRPHRRMESGASRRATASAEDDQKTDVWEDET
jgi:hypothetical protein